ncbi:hypothetical protein PoB_002321300 [Plakobranchus ocellatus]|uniref:Uncharacterized protein n=1 Tax=Plakobranchus ocellatus TaxID=259542 RepID=A0AAV3ZPE1_9GAST|nr:hypothetical protein PoB_002321300 [Plakobranchus ocellatus]
MKCNATKKNGLVNSVKETGQNRNADRKFMHAEINDMSGKKFECSSPGCITRNLNGKEENTKQMLRIGSDLSKNDKRGKFETRKRKIYKA